MRKIFASALVLLLTLFSFSVEDAHAAADTGVSCNGGLAGVSLTYDFISPLVKDSPSITVTIRHGGNLANGLYSLKVSDSSDRTARGWTGRIYDGAIQNGSDLVFTNVSPNGDKFESGIARVTLMTLENSGSAQVRNAICKDDFDVGVSTGPQREPNLLLNSPCAPHNTKGCLSIKTAFGEVSTDAAGFTRWILGFVLSISGGIVILIIVVSGIKLMTSQGDPEKVKNARDQLTAAIVGLLFIIFSLVILELITRNVLGLPGFGG